MRGESPRGIKRKAEDVTKQIAELDSVESWESVNEDVAWTLIVRLDNLQAAPHVKAQFDREFKTLPLEYTGQGTHDGKPCLRFSAYGF